MVFLPELVSSNLVPFQEGEAMKKKNMKISACIFILIGVFCLWRPLFSAGGVKAPLINVDRNLHTFPTVFEGKELSHTFTISNRGTADLEIKKVTHS